MKKAISHLRSNAVAYLALFVALGGTSYAAVSIPAGSVGTRQLRNGAVTPAKLNRRMIGASVRAWAEVNSSGSVTSSSDPAHTVQWGTLPANPGLGTVVFDQPVISNRCFPFASVEPNAGAAGASAVIAAFGSNSITLDMSSGYNGSSATQAVAVVVLCP